MKASDYIAAFLHAQGVERVYEQVGGMITHLIDSMYRHGGIRLVSTHHEQAAAFGAEGEARVTGTPGVAMATSGPGATNLITGIGSCFFDSTPAVFLTGQVNRDELRRDRPIRQLGFQETDIVSMVGPVTKGAWQIQCPEEIPASLLKAFTLARTGRPGPVLVDLPMDIQRVEIEGPLTLVKPARARPDSRSIDDLFTALARAERPLVLAGGGIRAARAGDLFRRFAHRLGIPVINSLMGVDALPAGDPLRVGLIGSYGNRWANQAVGLSDALLVLGSRLDIRQTGADTAWFGTGRAIYHVDCDAGEINGRVTGCTPIVADLHAFFEDALEALGERSMPDRTAWRTRISELAQQWPDVAELRGIPGINPNQLMHAVSAASPGAAGYVVDVGQHQMWAAQSLDLAPHQHFLTSGGMGAMGFALPAAVGATLASAGRPEVLIAGDGSFQLNIHELQTVVRNQLPLKMVVLNNNCHGMVRQFQESYFDERYQSTMWGYSAPDFSRVAQAYGISAETVTDPEELDGAIARMWEDPRKAHVLQVMIYEKANAYPKIAFGYPMTEMEPFVKPIAMEST